MLRLRTLGAVFVERDGALLTGAAAQRRVVALLAVLAVARDEGVSRDRVLGLLWPDSEPEKARQALAQAIYHARRAVAQDDLFSPGADLRLNRQVITSDVAEFEDALNRGELELAVSLYSGPFLESFYVGGTSEFEHWTSREQKRLADRCAGALERLALAAEASKDYRRAVDWRKQLAGLDPLNSRVTMNLMLAMAAAGDRAGAIQHARVHETLLRQELDVEPDAALSRLVERLRDDPTWSANPSEPPAVALAPSPPSGDVRGEALGGPPPRRRSFRNAQRLAVPGALLLFGAAAAVILASRSPKASVAETPPVRAMVVVAPFRVAGADPALSYLHEGMVDLLVTKLTDDEAALAADPGSVVSAWRRARLLQNPDVPRTAALRIARQLGADRLITGSIVGTPSRLVISASLVGVEKGDLRAQATVEGTVDSLNALVDRLATRLLAREAGAWDRLANRTSTSLSALRAFLDGQSAYRRGGYRDAVTHFKRALEVDSTFAMAGLGLAQAAERIGARAERQRGLATAWAARVELTERDRVYLDAFAGPRYPLPSSEREQLLGWERAAAVTPTRADVWHELGEHFFYDGQLLGMRNWHERAVAAFERAVELDSLFASPLQYLVQLAAHAGKTGAVRGLATRYLQLDSGGDLSAFVRWRSAMALSDSVRLASLRQQFSKMPPASLQLIALSGQFHAIEGRDAERALAVLLSRAVRGAERVEVHLGRHALALNRGRPAMALEVTDDIENLESLSTRAARFRVLDALYAEGDSGAAASSLVHLRRMQELPTRDEGALNDLCIAEQWRAWYGDVRTVRQAIGVLMDGAQRVPNGESALVCAALLDAIVAVRERRSDGKQRVERLDSLVTSGAILGEMGSYVTLAMARLHDAAGNPTRALAAVRRRPHMQPWPQYLAPALYQEARLAARTADTTAAVRAYRHFVTLRPDPEDRGAVAVAFARSELARLSAPSAK